MSSLENEKKIQTPKTAVILAAGNGTRLREHSGLTPKPLIKLGGLLLLERAILNLHASGIERFRVVVGYEKDQIRMRLSKLKSLRGKQIEFVECADFERGNGASLAAGARGLDESFLLTMADHVMDAKLPKAFIENAILTVDQSALATDKDIKGVFDLDDATKVRTKNGQISELSKELSDYDQVDTGLFYFSKKACPKVEAAYSQGAVSVSDIVLKIRDDEGFRAIPVEPGAFWQDVDTKEMAIEAETRMLNSLRKPTDGWVSKNINRHVSLRLSRLFVKWGVHPNAITTVVFFVTLGGAWMASTSNYLYMAIAGIIFQICSIVDGCDGEVARMTFKGSHFGAWYDTITDNIRYGVFFVSLGVGAYNIGHSVAYLWAMAFFAFSLIYMVGSMIRYERTIKAATHLVVTKKFEEQAANSNKLWDRIIMKCRGLIKQDVSALIVMMFCILGLGHWIFWLACVAIMVMTLTVTRALDPKAHNSRTIFWLFKSPYVLFVAGVALFGYLFSKVSAEEVFASLSSIGPGYLLIFFIAPPIWFAFNAMSLWTLGGYRIRLIDLFYNQVVGEAINALLPLAGLGGEPYKANHMSQWIPVEEATNVVVRDRLVHVVSGLLFSSLLGFITLSTLPMSPAFQTPVLAVSAFLAFLCIAFSVVSLSQAPTKFTKILLKRFKFLSEFENTHFTVRKFSESLFYKMLGRAGALLEAFIIFKCLGIEPGLVEVVAVTFLIAASAAVFFVVPQGLGVNEVGIAGAFQMIGLSTPMALAFGIARRIRVLFWAVLGVICYMSVTFFSRVLVSQRKVES
ncbi:NTP transferase domain-containing protein [bacterium]|nr:NTP transferase domain-containing protein [bacterium]